jgi:hypothetical protein
MCVFIRVRFLGIKTIVDNGFHSRRKMVGLICAFDFC